MTLGITLLILFLPLIGIFIGTYFDTITSMLSSALSVLDTVPAVAGGLWAVLPSQITELIIALLVLSLSVYLLQRILG